MDKLIEAENGATITNDGATVLQLLQVQHPAAALLVDVAQSQDLEVSPAVTTLGTCRGLGSAPAGGCWALGFRV